MHGVRRDGVRTSYTGHTTFLTRLISVQQVALLSLFTGRQHREYRARRKEHSKHGT
jgi:hypothetical protein